MRSSPIRVLAGALCAAALSGCLGLNDVSRVAEPGYSLNRDRAIVIVGIAAQGDWRPSNMSVALYEYSLEKQSITGNCWRWNKLEASSDGTRNEVQYFLFDVAPGYYAGGASARFAVPISSGNLMFEVPANRVVYLGDYVYKAADRRLELEHDLSGAINAIRISYPAIRGEIVTARAHPAPVLQMFACAP